MGDTEDDVIALLREAAALFDVGRAKDGIERASEAARRDPQNAEAYHVWALCLLADKQSAEAARMATEAIRLAPHEAANHRIRSRAMADVATRRSGAPRTQAVGEAIDAARHAVRLSPSDPNGHLVLAEALSLTKDSVAANEELQIAIRTAPNSTATWVTASLVAIRAKNWGAAISACERALALDANDYAALNNMGVALRGAGRAREGSEILARAAAIDPDAKTARTNLSRQGLRYARIAVLVVLIPIGFIAHIGLSLYLAFAIVSNIAISRYPEVVLKAERWAAPLALYFARRHRSEGAASESVLDRSGRTRTEHEWTAVRSRSKIRTAFLVVCAGLCFVATLFTAILIAATAGFDKIAFGALTVAFGALTGWVTLLAVRHLR